MLNPVRWATSDRAFNRGLEAGTEYTVTVTSRVVDFTDTPVEETSWTFTTAPEPVPPTPEQPPEEPITRVEVPFQAEACTLLPAEPPADGPVRLDQRSLAATRAIARAALLRAGRARLALTAAQARTSRRIARAALRRADALAARLTAG